MNNLKKVLPLAGLCVGLLAGGTASADFTANVGATSNYVWRGLTQSSNEAAISGGLDYAAPFGLYVGTWASNLAGNSGGQELDVYAGFAKEFGPVGLDVGVIRYSYPQFTGPDNLATTKVDESDINFNEFYVGVSFGLGKVTPSLMVSQSSNVFGTEESAMYVELGVDLAVTEELTLGLHAGSYNFDGDDPADATKTYAGHEDYSDYSVSLSKGEFTLTVSDTNLETDKTDLANKDFSADSRTKLYVTWSKEFDLLK